MATTKDDWHIKKLPATDQARRKITAYAALQGITIPQALAEIVKKAKI
jgi:hypothetical protein